jgi:hypothetical protein
MSTTSQDPDVLGGELVFAGTRVPVSPGQHGAGGMEHGGKPMDQSKPSEQAMAVLEDIDDLAVVQSRRSEPTIAHDDVVAMLKDAWNAKIPTEPQRWKSAKKQQLAETIREALTKK